MQPSTIKLIATLLTAIAFGYFNQITTLSTLFLSSALALSILPELRKQQGSK